MIWLMMSGHSNCLLRNDEAMHVYSKSVSGHDSNLTKQGKSILRHGSWIPEHINLC
jgi:hypothetical protein